MLFADADHAGEFDSKSAPGCAMFLVGPNIYFPLNAFNENRQLKPTHPILPLFNMCNHEVVKHFFLNLDAHWHES
jgi:hypothetical protein